MVQGVINIPLIEDKLAVRAVAYRFDNSGYIDNVAATDPATLASSLVAVDGAMPGQSRDIGEDEYTGFRLSALWKVNDNLNAILGYIHQEIEQQGIPEADLNLGDFQQARLNGVFGEGEQLTNELDSLNFVINYDFGWGTLTSSSSWIDYNASVKQDAAFFFFAPYFEYNNNGRDVFFEEIRLSSQLDGPFQFVIGGYYEDNNYDEEIDWDWSGAPLGFDATVFFDAKRDVEQKALFGEISYELTEQFTATVGARFFDYDDRYRFSSNFFPDPFDADDIKSSESGETFKVNLSYTPSDNMLVYGQWGQGFRLGETLSADFTTSICDLTDTDGNPGPDGLIDGLGIPAPELLESDNLDSFEIGIKTAFSDNRVTLNASIYHIDWEGLPVAVPLPACGSSVQLNAGKSTSEGVEVEIRVRAMENLSVDFSTSYGEATLAEDHPQLGSKGDDLPGSADFNLSLGLEYSFTLAGNDAFTRLDYAYGGDYFSTILAAGPEVGGFGQVHWKTGMTFGDLKVDLFVNNLTNVDDITSAELFSGGNRVYLVRPRTMGLNVGYSF